MHCPLYVSVLSQKLSIYIDSDFKFYSTREFSILGFHKSNLKIPLSKFGVMSDAKSQIISNFL